MKSTLKEMPKFFYGTTSADGFISLFDKIYDAKDGWRAYIIKGGPGSGKSTLIKKVAEELDDSDTFICPCSSDPDSLDAVVFPSKKVCIIDGTAPHIIEPKYPGICEEIINIGDCWDSSQLSSLRKEAIAAFEANSAHHKRAARYIHAAGSLLKDNYNIVKPAADIVKVKKFAKSFSAREIKFVANKRGSERTCFLSAVTPKGHLFFEDTIHKLCKRLIAVEDEYTVVSREILSVIREEALTAGHDIITCKCPILPSDKIEHIIIPSLSTAFCTSNSFHKVVKADRRIHTRRFLEQDIIYANKHKLSFNRKIVRELINSAAEILKDAKKSHDIMEQFYINAMDFNKLNEQNDKIIDKIKNLL